MKFRQVQSYKIACINALLVALGVVVVILSARTSNSWANSELQKSTNISPLVHRKYYVLGAIEGLMPPALSVFVQSWQRYSPDTKLALFVDHLDRYPTLQQFPNVEMHPITKKQINMTVKYQRYSLYKDFINLNRNHIAGVILTDVRDVAIQKDPWRESLVQQAIHKDAALFSMEGGSGIGGEVLVGSNGWNAGQIIRCLGPDVQHSLKDEVVSCSGVTLGTPNALLSYLDKIIYTIENVMDSQCTASGHGDQAAHNYALHVLSKEEKMSGRFMTPESWISPIHTSQYGWPLIIDEYSKVHRPKGVMPAVIHQWDRSEELKRRYDSMYGLWEVETYQGDTCSGCEIKSFSSSAESSSVGELSMDDQYTIITPTFRRLDILEDFLHTFAVHPCKHVDSIIVSWAEVDVAPPDFQNSESYSIPVHVYVPPSSSLNDRFRRPPVLSTDAVLHMDDDLRIKCADLDYAFKVWQQNQDKIVGFADRGHQLNSDGDGYVYHIHPLKRDETGHQYSIILTNAAFLHSKYMDAYFTDELPREVREFVTENRNCEDIAMNFLVANRTRAGQVLVHAHLSHLGSKPNAGISTQTIPGQSNVHYTMRCKCLKQFTQAYGYNPLDYAWTSKEYFRSH